MFEHSFNLKNKRIENRRLFKFHPRMFPTIKSEKKNKLEISFKRQTQAKIKAFLSNLIGLPSAA